VVLAENCQRADVKMKMILKLICLEEEDTRKLKKVCNVCTKKEKRDSSTLQRMHRIGVNSGIYLLQTAFSLSSISLSWTWRKAEIQMDDG